ncbi:hypothetical protein A3F55_02540 [Candidatus Adlerbacteria bacterium RIFCSPHIGHO2_12_FULL_53_18]|uniref:Uncharacterized protein n=1 Tax=Candidatus Adlerbacteria bacterium RIFCSPHIGHO2_12_FULL_53_18 TaxID=1797242 RepID=A0A1F4XSR3_9BACT|nr:MAG: hypothetical protein A3F55_02540 [Candidatus Adlerbacteria bacterium RIFCSPHIGHO2_12_FULL_53_18]
MNLRDDIVYPIVDFIDLTVSTLGGVVLVLFLIIVVRYIAKAGDAHGKSEERRAMGWGLLALFILFSIWGIINIFKQLVPYTNERYEEERGNTVEILEV